MGFCTHLRRISSQLDGCKDQAHFPNLSLGGLTSQSPTVFSSKTDPTTNVHDDELSAQMATHPPTTIPMLDGLSDIPSSDSAHAPPTISQNPHKPSPSPSPSRSHGYKSKMSGAVKLIKGILVGDGELQLRGEIQMLDGEAEITAYRLLKHGYQPDEMVCG